MILGLALLVLGAATAFDVAEERERTLAREQERLITQARVVQVNIGENLAAVDKVLAQLSHDVGRGDAGPVLDGRLKMLTDAMPSMRTLFALDATGTIRAASREELIGRNFAHRAYFREPRQRADADLLYISPPFRTVLGTFTINVSRIVRGPQGEFAGVVSAALDPAYFAPLLDSVRYTAGMWTAIAQWQGDVFMIVPEREGIPGKNVAQPDTFFSRHRADGAQTTVHRGTAYITGDERLLVWSTVQRDDVKTDAPLVVAAARELDDIFVGWRHDALIRGGLYGIIALSSLLGLYVFQRRQRAFDRDLDAYIAALEDARRASEDANIAKSRFLATMSHEIRTPMNGILGMAQLLMMSDQSEDERRDYARTILESGNLLLTLLNDILDLSKVEAGKFELVPTVFSPAQIVDEMAALFGGLADRKGLVLEAHWQGAAGQRYRGDAIRLRQMLSNFVSNALKFTERGGIRIVAAETAKDGATAQLRFAVSDSGIGIAPEDQALLFKPFSQVDASTTRKHGGTGLGLSIVASLAKLMDGEVGVDSAVGRGSTFWFSVRVGALAAEEESRSADRAAVAATASAAVRRGRARILVVEDAPVNRRLLEVMLGKLGYACRAVEDGAAAVRAVADGEAYDLVLMDCQMPVMDGFEATQCIRAWETDRAGARLPIVALTAAAFPEDEERCLACGMDDFLAKPIDMGKLAATLNKWTATSSCSSGDCLRLSSP